MADAAKSPPSNIVQRVTTGLIVAPIVLATVYFGGAAFTVLAMAMAILGIAEFYILAQNRASQGSTLVGIPTLVAFVLAFQTGDVLLLAAVLVVSAVVTFALEMVRHSTEVRRSLFQVGMTLFGVLYLGIPTAALISLRALPNGLVWLLLIFCVTWGTDSFAYIGGRLWGRTPLAPRLSPKKTVEGAAVGVAGGVIPALILLGATGLLSAGTVFFTLVGPFVAIAGDLFESGLKRFFQVKDSHIAGFDILPGHGGILDRTDALLLVSAFAYAVFMLAGLR
jgi:phosphatidate cytidylyltransferase